MRENLRRLNKQKAPCSTVGLMGNKPGFRTLSINLDVELAQLQCPGSPSAPISLGHTEPVPAAQIQIQRGWGVGHQLQSILGSVLPANLCSTRFPHGSCVHFCCIPNLREILQTWKGQDSRGTDKQNRCTSAG